VHEAGGKEEKRSKEAHGMGKGREEIKEAR